MQTCYQFCSHIIYCAFGVAKSKIYSKAFIVHHYIAWPSLSDHEYIFWFLLFTSNSSMYSSSTPSLSISIKSNAHSNFFLNVAARLELSIDLAGFIYSLDFTYWLGAFIEWSLRILLILEIRCKN